MTSHLQPASEPATGYPPQFASQTLSSTGFRIELPTLAVAAAIFGGYGALTWFFRDLPLWVSAPLGALWLTWYGSLQHETIHNHPSGSRRLNAALGSVPLSLWLPYRIYRVTHRQHHRHRGRHLTEAMVDPESFFLVPGSLQGCGSIRRGLFRANCTLAGRLVIGPALSLRRFWSAEAHALLAGNKYRQSVWLRHALACSLILLWITQVCHIPVIMYCMCFVYPSIALSHLRSFTEHRADPDPTARTVSVESSRAWSLLFLNNNLHIAHHTRPDIPWYRLPEAWERMRAEAHGRGLVFKQGYSQVLRRYLLKPVIEVEHPGLTRVSGSSP